MKHNLQQLEALDIPLKNLVAWDGNVRMTDADAGIKELAASIQAVGLLHSLVVEHVQRGKYPVVAGRRRWLALSFLQQQGVIAPSYKVPCRVLPEGTDFTEVSLAENVERESMHPLDECAAFQALIDSGKSSADVAARFGYTETTVERRLALARLSPVLQNAFRTGEVNLDALQAFTLTTDQERQEQVWQTVPKWNRTASYIRELLSSRHVSASDPRVRFVGLNAYEEAGGSVVRDLFSSLDGQGIQCIDVTLLNELVTRKLEASADGMREDGWKWIEIDVDTDRSSLGQFRRLPGKPLPLPEKLEKQRAKLEARRAALAKAFDGLSENADSEEAAKLEEDLDRIEDDLAAIEQQRPQAFPKKVKANCGVIVTLDQNGKPRCIEGLLRKEDQAAFDSSKSQQDVAAEHEQDLSSQESPAVIEDTGYSAALIESLTLEKTAALAAELSQQPQAALAATVHSLVVSLFGLEMHLYYSERAIQISTRQVNFTPIESSAAAQYLAKQQADWLQRLPRESEAALWEWCFTQPSETLLQLLAFCTALTVNAVQGKSDRLQSPRLQNANALAQALHLDMTRWFTPAADNFFSRISKSDIAKAMTEAGKPASAETLALKKAELAEVAAKLTAGTGWLPQPIRTQHSETGQ